MTTLIFPSSHSVALDFYYQALARGEKAVAASSLKYDETSNCYREWFHLPMIYDNSFIPEFKKALKLHAVTKVFCPSTQIYTFLEKCIKDEKLKVKLVGSSPATLISDYYKALEKQAEDAKEFIKIISSESKLPMLAIASALKQIGHIYGESHYTKLLAMMAIFSEAPKGDVVEIGTLLGRTAFLLHFLARQYKTGSTLAIDAWDAATTEQKDSPEMIQKIAYMWDWQTAFAAFRINMISCSDGTFNYIRAASRKAHGIYSNNRAITTPEFGSVDYSGQISILHIDGNHDYAAVNEDYQMWRPHVKEDGWVILDDYIWPHGDGPKKVGDRVLETERQKISRAFTAGNALFLKF